MLTLQAQGDLHLGVEDHLASSLTKGGIDGRKDSSSHHSGKRGGATGLAVPATPQLRDHQKIHYRKADQTNVTPLFR